MLTGSGFLTYSKLVARQHKPQAVIKPDPMRNLRLYTNQAVPEDARQKLAADLGEVLPISESAVIHQKSEDVSAVVQIALEAFEWITPLKAAATYLLYQIGKGVSSFSSRLSERAADAVIDRWVSEKELTNSLDDKPLQRVANAIVEVIESTPGQTQVRIGLPIPDDFMVSHFQIESIDQNEIAIAIALFVLQAEEIERILKKAKQDNGIFGYVKLTLQRDGRFEAEWKDDEFNQHKVIIGENT